MQAERVVKGVAAGPGEGERRGSHEVEQWHLEAAVLGPQPGRPVDGPGHDECADDGRRRQRGQQTEDQQQPGSCLGGTRDDRHGLARPEPEGMEEPCSAVEARAAEQTEELLAAMADQQKTEDEPQNEQTCIHCDPSKR